MQLGTPRRGRNSAPRRSRAKRAARPGCPLCAGSDSWAECCRQKFLSLARGIVGTREDAEDAFQQGCLRILLARGSYRGDPPACGWARKIFERCSFDILRARERAAAEPLPEDDIELGDSRPNPEAATLQSERDRLVRETVAALPGIYRQVLELRESRQLGIAEIARHLHLSRSNASTRLGRAHSMLAKRLATRGLASRKP